MSLVFVVFLVRLVLHYAILLYMMGYGYGSMMVGWGLFGAITWLVVVVDLILVGVWLWQNISKK